MLMPHIVSEFMAGAPITLSASAPVQAGVQKRPVRRIPVVDNGRAVGILSLGDLAVANDPRSALGGISAARPNI